MQRPRVSGPAASPSGSPLVSRATNQIRGGRAVGAQSGEGSTDTGHLPVSPSNGAVLHVPDNPSVTSSIQDALPHAPLPSCRDTSLLLPRGSSHVRNVGIERRPGQRSSASWGVRPAMARVVRRGRAPCEQRPTLCGSLLNRNVTPGRLRLLMNIPARLPFPARLDTTDSSWCLRRCLSLDGCRPGCWWAPPGLPTTVAVCVVSTAGEMC